MNMLQTENIRLRALEPEDIDILYKWENDTRIWKISNTLAPFSKYILRRFIEDQKYDIYETKQLRMIIESRSDKRPTLSARREAGATEQDADIVMFLYREGYYDKETPTPNLAECIIAKNRHGETRTVELQWLPEFTTFGNMEWQHEEY